MELHPRDRGRSDALRDLEANRWIHKGYGLIGGAFERWCEILRDEYGISVELVAGCCATIDEIEYVHGYNETVERFLDDRFGVGTLARTYERAVAELKARAVREAELMVQQLSVEREAQTDLKGWITCPHCAIRFALNNQNVWDGERHLSCRGRIKVLGVANQEHA